MKTIRPIRGFAVIDPNGKMLRDFFGNRGDAQFVAARCVNGKFSALMPDDWHAARKAGYRVVRCRIEAVR